MVQPLTLHVLPGEFAVCRLPADAPLPAWLHLNAPTPLVSVTRTRGELSIVLPAAQAPNETRVERGWRCLGIEGPLDFGLIGVVAGVTGALAGAGLSVFVVSTFDTDYILVRAARLHEAISALARAGYHIHSDPAVHTTQEAP